jgi:hypothetical protein
MDTKELEALTWREPWELIPLEQREVLDRELDRELCAAHALAGTAHVAVARRVDRDDVLFIIDDERLALVHLTWNRETDPRWPMTIPVADVASFVSEHMKPDHEDLFG